MIEEIRKRLIESDMTSHDLRIALNILEEVERKESERTL